MLRELEVESVPQAPNLNPLIFPLRKIPVISSTPESDVFGLCDSSTFIYCNLRFVEMARKNGWNFLRFTPLDMPKKLGSYWFIDHLGKQWPPQWYPDGVNPHPANQSCDDGSEEVSLHGIIREPKANLSEVPKKSIVQELLAAQKGWTSTGHEILGETVYWSNSEGVSASRVKKVQRALLPFLASALATAEKTLSLMAAKAVMEPEIDCITIDISMEGPPENWTLNVHGYIDGPCPYYGLDFEGERLIDVSGAD